MTTTAARDAETVEHAERDPLSTDELAARRKITIIKRLRRYLDGLCANGALVTSIVPIGDGAAVSYKI